MNRTKVIKNLFVLLILGVFCIGFTAMKQYTYDWEAAVSEHMKGYTKDLVYFKPFKDADSGELVYKYQTADDLSITFEIRCFWGNIVMPFGFEIPIKEAKIVDNFPEKVDEYISKKYGTYHIDGKTIEEISAYVLDTIQKGEVLYQKYGINYYTPKISFVFVKKNQTYKFKYGNDNATILRDRLTELLYK